MKYVTSRDSRVSFQARALTITDLDTVAGGAVNQSGSRVPDGKELIRTIEKIVKIITSAK